MWMCKICGQNNDDSADSCMLCGGTEKEHYTPPPTPKVVVLPPLPSQKALISLGFLGDSRLFLFFFQSVSHRLTPLREGFYGVKMG